MKTSRRQTDLEILACNLLWLRKQHHYSQREMATRLEIGVLTLRKLEHGILPPRLGVDFLFVIQKHFGIAPSVLLSKQLEMQ